jgi:hypothetical protein
MILVSQHDDIEAMKCVTFVVNVDLVPCYNFKNLGAR